MSNERAGLLRHVHQLWNLGSVVGLTDAQLLDQFAARHDDRSELAFQALVERHGPMVFRVCRGVLRDEHAAEDAFQATFLVLARKASSLCVNDSLGSWLHGVAHRVASRAKGDAACRRRHEVRLAEVRGPEWEVVPDQPFSDAWATLSEEIARLPETYRAPIVLCYLESMSYQAVADILGVSEDTIRGRLARARERLRARLTRRGIESPAIVGVTRPLIPAVAVRPSLVDATTRAATTLSASRAAVFGLVSQSAISLSERTCKTMMLTKLRAYAATVVLGVLAAGAAVSAQSGGGRPEQTASAATLRRTPQSIPGTGGNLLVDWIPADGKGGKKEITVNPARHCIYLSMMSLKASDRPDDGVLRIDLVRGKTYKVTASGEAFMTAETGVDADPFPGVVLLYGTDEEDCYAIRQTVLAPGKAILFRSPWNIDPKSDVFLKAFFLDYSPEADNRGSYTLTIEETGEQAVNEHTIKPASHTVVEKDSASYFHVIRDASPRPNDVPKNSASPDNPAPKP